MPHHWQKGSANLFIGILHTIEHHPFRDDESLHIFGTSSAFSHNHTQIDVLCSQSTCAHNTIGSIASNIWVQPAAYRSV
jgi:hypothetical protein